MKSSKKKHFFISFNEKHATLNLDNHHLFIHKMNGKIAFLPFGYLSPNYCL